MEIKKLIMKKMLLALLFAMCALPGARGQQSGSKSEIDALFAASRQFQVPCRISFHRQAKFTQEQINDEVKSRVMLIVDPSPTELRYRIEELNFTPDKSSKFRVECFDGSKTSSYSVLVQPAEAKRMYELGWSELPAGGAGSIFAKHYKGEMEVLRQHFAYSLLVNDDPVAGVRRWLQEPTCSISPIKRSGMNTIEIRIGESLLEFDSRTGSMMNYVQGSSSDVLHRREVESLFEIDGVAFPASFQVDVSVVPEKKEWHTKYDLIRSGCALLSREEFGKIISDGVAFPPGATVSDQTKGKIFTVLGADGTPVLPGGDSLESKVSKVLQNLKSANKK